jgi:hypothetical protein
MSSVNIKKHLPIAAVMAVITGFTLPAFAECEDDAHGIVNISHELWAANSHAEEQDKSHRANENSNRQSDADSTRGQARAEERHEDKKNHNSKDYGPWYHPRGLLERARDNPWYNPLGLFND